ncbi:hypothetical protein [Furfurilactobacillus curtus]|uniref:hypothetical protein n=1 Tax=Furfurilactobacillus curtus TaxID=1746200 RepID=UPI0038B2516D
MAKRSGRLLKLIWGLMLVSVLILTIWPAHSQQNLTNLVVWWIAFILASFGLVFGWRYRKRLRGRVLLATMVALTVVFGLFVLLVALFAEHGIARLGLALVALSIVITGILWYGRVYEQRQWLNTGLDDHHDQMS